MTFQRNFKRKKRAITAPATAWSGDGEVYDRPAMHRVVRQGRSVLLRIHTRSYLPWTVGNTCASVRCVYVLPWRVSSQCTVKSGARQ